MPPRSKQSKVDWITCSLCHQSFSSKDQGKHDESCEEESSQCTQENMYGHVQSGILHGLVSSTDIEVQGLPAQYSDCVLCVHPLAMRLCGLCIGAPVVVGNSQVLYVWPNTSLPLAGLALSAVISGKLIQTGDIVTVQSLPEPHLTATRVCLKPDVKQDFFSHPEFPKYVRQRENGKFIMCGNNLKFNYYGKPCALKVVKIDGPEGDVLASTMDSIAHLSEDISKLSVESNCSSQYRTFYKVSTSTEIVIASVVDDDSSKKKHSCMSLKNVGGLHKHIDSIKELINLTLLNKKKLQLKGLHLPKGVLLYGPSGTGKSMLANALAVDSGVHVITLNGAEIWSKFYGETESKLETIFNDAKLRAPSIILVDEIDTLCPTHDTSSNAIEKRVVAALLNRMDDLFRSDSSVLVIATTNKPDNLDPALRRPGRLDREIEISVPTADERADILEKLLASTSHTLSKEEIMSIAKKAHGFVGADISAVCKEAGVCAIRREDIQCQVTLEDIQHGLASVQPSAMREVALEVPEVCWSDIGGQDELKHKLRQAIEWPLLHPEAFERLGIRPPRGLLMYGPPGCSKTMIAKALARESGINFIGIKGPELFSKYVGESERAVREVFRKARAAAPAIIFFDEIDALAGERGSSGGSGEVSDRVLAQLLTEMDGVDALKDVTIVAATNRPDRIDKALLRPGRLDRIVYVPLPNTDTRKEILTIQLRRTPTAEDVMLEQLVSCTEGYSGAEVTAVCHEAALCAMQEDLNIACVHNRHFEHALTVVKPQINSKLVQFYADYQKDSGMHNL